MPPPCPLCQAPDSAPFSADRRRDYLRCRHCLLVFTPPEYHLDRGAEKAHYDLHQNRPDDPGYRQFLNRLAEPLASRLTAGARGLDFGSGPGPTLSLMLAERGFATAIYDPYYAADPSVLTGSFDFVTATEVVEHLAHPGRELNRLWSLIRPGGWLGLMTKLVLEVDAFARWHYKNDPTHICFFSRETFLWLGRQWGASPEFVGSDVILMQKADGDLPAGP